MFKINKWFVLFVAILCLIQFIVWIPMFIFKKELVENTFIGFISLNLIILLGLFIYVLRIGKKKIELLPTDQALINKYLGENIKEVNKNDIINIRKRNGINLIFIIIISLLFSLLFYFSTFF